MIKSVNPLASAKNLLLFTNAFPTSYSQENYLIEEMPYLSRAFEKVLIVPFDKETIKHHLAGNTQVDYMDNKVQLGFFEKIKTLISYLPWIYEEIRKPAYLGSDLKMLVREVLIAKLYAEGIKRLLKKHAFDIDETVFYTYWFNTFNLSFAMLKKEYLGLKAYSRAHQADVYFQPVQKDKTSFYEIKLSAIQKLFIISEHGVNYLKKRYPLHSSKLRKAYLGIKDNGVNPFDKNAVFTIVSVSKLDDNKRVFLIPEILDQLDFPVRWIHFGWSNDADVMKVKNAIGKLNKNATAELMGMRPNGEILEFYKHNQVNLFMNVSVIEGLSFAAIEALSFGIPLLLTYTNAAGELVKDNGFVMPVNFEVKEAADLITRVRQADEMLLRKNSRSMFMERFDASKNYSEFIKEIAE